MGVCNSSEQSTTVPPVKNGKDTKFLGFVNRYLQFAELVQVLPEEKAQLQWAAFEDEIAYCLIDNREMDAAIKKYQKEIDLISMEDFKDKDLDQLHLQRQVIKDSLVQVREAERLQKRDQGKQQILLRTLDIMNKKFSASMQQEMGDIGALIDDHQKLLSRFDASIQEHKGEEKKEEPVDDSKSKFL